jgi:hypothetical protein
MSLGFELESTTLHYMIPLDGQVPSLAVREYEGDRARFLQLAISQSRAETMFLAELETNWLR